MRLWARTTHGIEWIAAAEASLLPDATILHVRHRDVLLDCGSLDAARGLRCVDDVYALWADAAGLGHTRSSLAILETMVRRLPLPAIPIPGDARALRVTASMLGRRNYSRFEVEAIVGAALSRRLGLAFLPSASAEADDALWCRVHLYEDRLCIGLKPGTVPLHRRSWRTEALAGALHPPVAAAMALLCQPEPGQAVLDPFAGSGTLLIEAGMLCGGLSLMGMDIDEAAVRAAAVQGRQAGVVLDMRTGDAMSLAGGTVDRILSNPPWGRRVSLAGGANQARLSRMLLAPLRRGGRAVLLADQDLHLAERLAGCSVKLRLNARISGRLVHIIILDEGELFADSPIGRALALAWDRYRPIPAAGADR